MITIDDIKTGYLLKALEKMTEYEFNIVSDVGAYMAPRRNKNTVKHYINGLFTLRGVDIQKLNDGREAMGFEFSLDFLIPLDDRATIAISEENYVSTVYQSVMDFRNALAETLSGSTTANIKKDGNTYTGGVFFNLPTVGKNSIRQAVGNSVTYSCSISLALLEGGINTWGLTLNVDDEPVPYSSIKMTRNPSLSADLMSDSKNGTSSVYAESTQFKIEFSAPAIKGAAFNNGALSYLLGENDANKTYAVEVRVGDHIYNQEMIFGGCEMQGSGVSNLAYSISLVPYTATEGM